MGFEQEAVGELYASVWGNRSKMQREFTRGAHGEQFVLRELSPQGHPDAVAVGDCASSQLRPYLHRAVIIGKEGLDYARH